MQNFNDLLWSFAVDLHERSWVEKIIPKRFCRHFASRPPREVVSWKAFGTATIMLGIRRPPREVVSWKNDRKHSIKCTFSRPPREVVSWKVFFALRTNFVFVDLHERSWVEKFMLSILHSTRSVDLHERSWVEKSLQLFHLFRLLSTSTRGRELKN